MATTNVRVVQGLCIQSATIANKTNQVKLVLNGEKDEIRAGTGTVADVLVSLEFHSTGADTAPVSVALHNRSFEFSVETFLVKQDKLKVVLKTSEDENGDNEDVNAEILSAVANHVASNTPIELTMAAARDVVS